MKSESKNKEQKYLLQPAVPDDEKFLFTLTADKDAEFGTIGHLRIDFGSGGKEFWSTWWPRGDENLNNAEFKAELSELVNELRETGPLKDLNAMYSYCCAHGGEIKGGWRQNYGYVSETEHYRYYLRCNPGHGDYHAYLTIFDLRVQAQNAMNKTPTRKYGLSETGKQKLLNAADNTLPHSYSWFVFQDYNQRSEKFTNNLSLK